MMVTRVALLLLVTGLFAGMWSADSPDGRSSAEKQLARRASSPCAVRDLFAKHRFTTPPLHAASVPVPLPPGIAPGTYLAVNQLGAIRRIIVPAPTADSENSVPVDQYTVHNGNMRWHFIRLEESTEALTPARRVTAARLP